MPEPLESPEAGVPGGIAPSAGIASAEPIASSVPEFTPPPPEPSTPPESETVSFREAFSQRGFAVDQYPDDDQLMDFISGQMQQAGQVPQLQQLAQFGQQVAPYANEFYQWLDEKQKAGQAPAVPAAAEPEPEPYWPEPPEWNQQWEQFLTVDQDPASPTCGQIVASPGARPDLVAKYHDYQAWKKEREQTLFRDPFAAIEPKFKTELERFKEELRETVRQDRAQEWDQRQQQQVANSAVLANQDWLYQWGANGQPLIDPRTGKPAFSQEGQVFFGLLQQCEASGMTDQSEAWQMSMEALPGRLARMGLLKPAPGPGNGTPAAPGQPAIKTPSPREAANQRFVSDALAAHEANRGQTVVSAAQPHGPTQNALRSWGQIAEQTAAEAGIDMKK